MGDFPRKPMDGGCHDGVQAPVVQQMGKGEKTLAQLGRELDISPTILRRWQRPEPRRTAVKANEDVVPASQLREAHQRIRKLERLLG